MAAITLSGCAGAAMALAGMAYWSLATQNVVYVALNTAPLLRYRLALFLKDILPFALAAAATSLCTWAAALYYGVMRVAGAHILEECMQFLKGKR